MGPEAPLDAGNAYALRDAGAAGQAWRAVHRSGVALVSALAALLVVLAHLAVEDMRAAGQRIGEVLRR